MQDFDLTNAILLSVVVVGGGTLLISFINRIHAVALPESVLKCIRHTVDVLLLMFSVLLFWKVGFTGPALIWGGSLHDVSPLWKTIMAVSACGFLGTIWSLLRFQLYRPPVSQTLVWARIFDVEKTLGYRPTARGPYSSLVNVPFNEQFKFEWNHKELQLEKLPVEFDGLRILHLSDWHFSGSVQLSFFEAVCEQLRTEQYDLIVFSGDLVDQKSLISWIPQTLGTLKASLGEYYVLGNHDSFSHTLESRDVLQGLGWKNLASQVVTIERGTACLELGGDETPWMGTHPVFGDNPETFKVLVSHSPDQFHRAAREQTNLVLAGHTHGGQVRLPVIGPVFSPSLFGCSYASGTFERNQTTMHVSRGLSGIHPLRIRCLPEVTLLTLRSANCLADN